MLIVSDASPLIALALCDKLDLLDKLFDQVCIPPAVFQELTIPNKPKVEMIATWAKNRIVSVKNTSAVTAFSMNLDSGESEALALYREINADYLLIDEKKGRTIAARNGIRTVGTIGVLVSAKQRGFLVEVKPSLDTLISAGFRMSDILYRQILERAGE
jgi:predicted nucleic acid-binding protein